MTNSKNQLEHSEEQENKPSCFLGYSVTRRARFDVLRQRRTP